MRKVIFSKNAQFNLEDLLEYLKYNFSLRIQTKFIEKLNKVIFLIKKDPEIFPITNKNFNFRRCVLSKQTTIYYTFNDQEINVLSFFDTRQNPKKINKIK